jgi:hypothetical protein
MAKLWKVTLCGMQYNGTGCAHGISYVIADDSDEAYNKVKTKLETMNLGRAKERELKTIELIAEDAMYADCGMTLYM